jgi:hypothetical protein
MLYDAQLLSASALKVRRVRRPRGGDVPVECGCDTPRRRAICVTPMSELTSNVRAAVSQFLRSASGAANAPRGRKAGAGALPEQSALEFCQDAEYLKGKKALRGRRVEDFGQTAKADVPDPSCSIVSINCFIDRANRSSFHTTRVSLLRANSSGS